MKDRGQEGTGRGLFRNVSRSFALSSYAPLSLLFSMSMSNKHFGKIIKQANPHRKISISMSQVKHSMTREQNENKLRTARIELAVITAGIITHIRRLL